MKKKPARSLLKVKKLFEQKAKKKAPAKRTILKADSAKKRVPEFQKEERMAEEKITEVEPPKEKEEPIAELKEEEKLPPESVAAATEDILKQAYKRKDLPSEIEALLFSSGKAMSVDELASLTASRRPTVKKALEQLKETYSQKGGALFVIDDGDKWKFSVKEKHLSLVRKIVSDMELSKSLLETLAVIAWKSPISQAELVRIRSTKVYDHVPKLEESGFVTKDREGRSYSLKITQKFYDYFELSGDHQIKQIFTGVPEKAEEKQEQKKQELKEREEALKDIDAESSGSGNMENSAALSEEQKVQMANEENEEYAKNADEANSFLNDIDSKIDAISKRHDEIKLKPDEIPQQQSTENAASDSGNQEAGGTPAFKEDKLKEKKEDGLPRTKTQIKNKIMAELEALKGKSKRLSGLKKKKSPQPSQGMQSQTQ